MSKRLQNVKRDREMVEATKEKRRGKRIRGKSN
jgi:hypothetical protein